MRTGESSDEFEFAFESGETPADLLARKDTSDSCSEDRLLMLDGSAPTPQTEETPGIRVDLNAMEHSGDEDILFDSSALAFQGEGAYQEVASAGDELCGESGLLMLDGTAPTPQTEETPGVRVDLNALGYSDDEDSSFEPPLSLSRTAEELELDLQVKAGAGGSDGVFLEQSPRAELLNPPSPAPRDVPGPGQAAPARQVALPRPLELEPRPLELGPEALDLLEPGPQKQERPAGRRNRKETPERRFGTARLQPVSGRPKLQTWFLVLGIIFGAAAVGGALWFML